LEKQQLQLIVKQLLEEGSQVRIKLTGISMFPVLKHGSFGIIQKKAISELKPGQIIAFEQDAKLVLHRLHKIKDGRLTTRGDSMKHFDTPFAFESVLGGLVGTEINGKFLSVDRGCFRRTSWFCLRFPFVYYYYCRFALRFRKRV
jgi:hypothetical protein